MNELFKMLANQHAYLVALETRMINMEAKIDELRTSNSLTSEIDIPTLSVPKEYPQSAGDDVVAEQL